MVQPFDYNLFNQFIEEYISCGFQHISREDPLIVEMERKLHFSNQFFYIGDLINIKVLFASNGVRNILGIEPNQVGPGVFYRITHSDELERYNLSRDKLFRTGHELYTRQKGVSFLSTQFRLKNANGQYSPILFQGYSFYSQIPYKTVFILFVFTDISSFRLNRHGYHLYLGDNAAFFRYPDKQLLQVGPVFSGREIEILRLISTGLDSEQIADYLHLSLNTVSTHRRNILKKSKKPTTHDIVIELKEGGIL